MSDALDFSEIRRLVTLMPGPDAEAESQVSGLGLGRLERLAQHLACWQGRSPPRLLRARVACFAAGADPATTAGIQTRLLALAEGRDPLTRMLRPLDVDLRVYELDLSRMPSSAEPLQEAEACHALAYGLMAAETGLDVLSLGILSPEGDAGAATARAHAVLEALQAGQEPLVALLAEATLAEFAALGAMIACRLGRIPVLLDEAPALAVAQVLEALAPGAMEAMLPVMAPRDLAARLELHPLLDLGQAQGWAGAGAALALPLLKAAAGLAAGAGGAIQAS